MPRRYFRLTENMQTGNWDLGDPLDESGQEVEDPYVFTTGQPVHVEDRLTIPVDQRGRRLDFSLAGLGVAPVVHPRVAALFTKLAPEDVQLIPVDVQDCPDPYFILVATKLIRCIDDDASEEVLYWKPEDERPEMIGQYRSVAGMRIDRSKVSNAQVFRPWGWDVALIVSEDIKQALERARATGVRFKEV